MILQQALRWLRSAGAIASIALGVAAPAQAAVYTGIWDPTYGSPFSADFGWRGTATFFVPDFCKSAGTADVLNTPDCNGLASVLSAQVEFYDTDNPLAVLSTLTFSPGSIGINVLRYEDGALTGLDTSLSNFVNPGEDLSAYFVGAAEAFSLQFRLGADDALGDGPRLGHAICETSCQVQGFNSTRPTFTIAEVPEPHGLALAGAALLAAVFVGRRQRRPRAG